MIDSQLEQIEEVGKKMAAIKPQAEKQQAGLKEKFSGESLSRVVALPSVAISIATR